jgi:tRNA pseudouridine55 synthase
LDITGEILTESAVNIDPERIVSVVADLQGEVKLPIPMFSAKKLNGKKLYEYARAGERIEIPQKVMNFYDFKDLQINSPEVQLEFRCSKGSFVRSWSSEFGTRLGVGAALAELRRTYSAPYSIEKALPLDEIAQRLESQRGVEPSGELEITESLCSALLGPAFLPLAEALPNLPAFTITGKDERLLFNGQVPQVLQRRMIQIQKRVNQEDHGEMVRILSGSTGRLQAIVEVSPKKSLKIRRNFR